MQPKRPPLLLRGQRHRACYVLGSSVGTNGDKLWGALLRYAHAPMQGCTSMYCAPLHASPRLNCSAHAFPLIRRCGAGAAVHDRFVEKGVHASDGFNHPVATRIVAGRGKVECRVCRRNHDFRGIAADERSRRKVAVFLFPIVHAILVELQSQSCSSTSTVDVQV